MNKSEPSYNPQNPNFEARLQHVQAEVRRRSQQIGGAPSATQHARQSAYLEATNMLQDLRKNMDRDSSRPTSGPLYASPGSATEGAGGQGTMAGSPEGA